MTAAVMPVRAVTFLGLLAVALACAGLPLHFLAPLNCFTGAHNILWATPLPPGVCGLSPASKCLIPFP